MFHAPVDRVCDIARDLEVFRSEGVSACATDWVRSRPLRTRSEQSA
jgi:hypothetical protein